MISASRECVKHWHCDDSYLNTVSRFSGGRHIIGVLDCLCQSLNGECLPVASALYPQCCPKCAILGQHHRQLDFARSGKLQTAVICTQISLRTTRQACSSVSGLAGPAKDSQAVAYFQYNRCYGALQQPRLLVSSAPHHPCYDAPAQLSRPAAWTISEMPLDSGCALAEGT